MTRLLACAVTAAAVAFAPAASAAELCVEVDKTGTIGPPLTVGPVCVPYTGPDVCRTLDLTFHPTAGLELTVCTQP
jgi:hypothetical protein